MELKIKLSMLLMPAVLLLSVAGTAFSQRNLPIDDPAYKPPAEFQRYSAGKIDGVKAYINTYYFEDIPAEKGLSGAFGIQKTASKLILNPGYKAEVCGTFGGTKKYLCVPYFGLDRKVSAPANPETEFQLKVFSDVDKITISKWRLPGEVILWYGRGNHPIAIEGFHVFSQENHFPNPGAVWIPEGYWARFCQSETPKAGECQTFTEDESSLKQPIKYIRIGKGSPPPLRLSPIGADLQKKPAPSKKTKKIIKKID